MTKQKEVKRIKIRENKDPINRALSRMQDAIDVWESFSEHLNSINLEMPDKTRLAVIKKGFKCDESISYIKNELKDLPNRVREREELLLFDELNEWKPIFNTQPDWTHVEIKKGVAKPIKDVEKVITEKHSYYLTEKEDIDLYNQFMSWVEQGNAIWEDLKPINKGNLQFLQSTLHPKDNGGIWVANEAINFSKSKFKNQ